MKTIGTQIENILVLILVQKLNVATSNVSASTWRSVNDASQKEAADIAVVLDTVGFRAVRKYLPWMPNI